MEYIDKLIADQEAQECEEPKEVNNECGYDVQEATDFESQDA